MIATYPVDVNLWMPVPNTQDIQVVIRNKHELSQFWNGEVRQAMPASMQQVLKTGTRVTVTEKPGMVSVLAPVRNSLGEIVGLVEVVSSNAPPAHDEQ
jgi:chaperonin GroEL (HSP60 family)